MMLALYRVLGALVLLGLVLLAPFVPALRRGLAERLGLGPRRDRAPAADQTVWVHAASVGEVAAAAPLVGELLRRRPQIRVLISTFTASGRRLAERRLAAGEPRVRCRMLPIDWGWIPRRAIRRERPALFVLLETELWPELLRALGREGVPVLIANGRISPASFGRYRAVRKALRSALDAVTLALVRTTKDAERYEAIGLDPARLRVAGNLKHSRGKDDQAATQRRDELRRRLGAGRPVLVAGSTRGAENDLVLEAFRRLRARVPELLLVLAPRHPERFDPERLQPWAGSWVRWSAATSGIGGSTAVVLLDTLGELEGLYAAATVACVGGTWAGRGGHNLLEPAHHGVPVLFGPDYRHFQDEGRALLAAAAGFLARDAEALVERCGALLSDRGAREEAGRQAREVAAAFGGAVDRVADAACGLLDEPRSRA